MPRDASELAHRLAREAEAVCRHYLSNGRREGRYWLVGDVRNTPGRSMFVRLRGVAEGAGRQMDRRRDRRARRLARRHPRKLRPSRFPRCRRRGATLPEPASLGSGAIAESCTCSGADGIAGGGTAAVRHVAADRTDRRGNVFAQSRHYGFARRRRAALSSALLLSPRRGRADRDLAGDDRPRHRSRRPDHRRTSDLARLRQAWQGADRHAATRDGRPARQRGPLRCGERRARGRRRHRDHAVAALRAADLADGRGAFGQSPRRHTAPADACADSISPATPMRPATRR